VPQNAAARRDRGLVYDSLSQWVLAVADFSEALKLDATDTWLWHHRGYARAQLHDWSGALADFSEALRLDQKRPLTWMKHGEVLAERRQWAKARADFEKALELSPEEVMCWFTTACLYVQCADEEGYRKLSKRMYDRFGESQNTTEIAVLAHAWTVGAQANSEYARVRQLAQLRMELTDVTNRESSYRALSTHILGLACYRTGEYDKAVALLEKAVHGDSSCNISNYLVLAMAHHRLAHVVEAREWLTKAEKLIEQEAKLAPDGGFTPPGRVWWDWLCVQMLLREAEAALGNRENANGIKSKG